MTKPPDLADYNLDKSKINYYIDFYKKFESYSNRVNYTIIIILALYFDYRIIQRMNPDNAYEVFLLIVGFIIYALVLSFLIFLIFSILQIFLPIERVLYLIPKLKNEKVLADAYSQRHQKYIADIKKFDEIKRQENQELEKLRIQEERRQRQLEINYWTRLSGFEYEKEVAILFREIGYKVHLTKSTGDGGIDLLLYDGSGKVVVQCKNHNKRISPGAVRDLYGTCISEKASKAIMICSGGFSDATRKFALGKPIDLLDVHDLIRIRKTGFYDS
jgi:HJR/Mrr/RecB family endonuclease